MPLKRYGVLTGRVVDCRTETTPEMPHYQIRVEAAGAAYRVAVNVQSQESPSDLLYLVDDAFQHPITVGLPGLAEGFTPLPSRPGGSALDFIRGNLFDRIQMRPLPPNVPGPNNDLNEKLDDQVQRAARDPQARLYAFGQRWGPEPTTPDKVFGFLPGNGVHDIHMNQGNVDRFVGDDGVWQDGGLILHFPAHDRWVAIFLAFQSQAWHTDDRTGHALANLPEFGPAHLPAPTEPDGEVRIVAALVNPLDPATEAGTVTLLNASRERIDLTGWALLDRLKRAQPLSGIIAAGGALVVALTPPVELGADGGIITLLNRDGLKVSGVSYTAQQAGRVGWTIVF